MNMPADTDRLDNPQSVLDAIHALLETGGAIDEARAKQVRKAVDALRNGEEIPADDADSPVTETPATDDALAAQIDSGLEALRERVNRQVERRNRDYEKSLQLVQEVEAALKASELHHAEQAYHKLMSIMGDIPGLSEQRWRDIEKRLNRVRPRLRKLESWRHWGTTQVRQELIGQIRQLQDAGLPPPQLAERIKAARAQWQEWDKSGDHAGKELWQEFDSACEQAYKPCAEYFKQLKQQRRDNLKQRQAFIDRLNAQFEATDWKDPDWRGIDRLVRQARRDFHRIGNVDYRHRKPLAKALDAVLEKFDQYLSRERERSLRIRERLITDIEALAGVDNLREAIESLEALKKQWVVTVSGKRGVENRLWKRFQQAGDAIYRKRDAARRQHDAERQDNLRQKQALIEELSQAAAAPDPAGNASALTRIQDRWADIGAVPRREEQQLEKRWRAAQQQFRKAVKSAQSRARATALDILARRAALCEHWEQAVLAGAGVDMDHARAEWDSLPALPGAAADAMETRFRQAFTRADDTTLAANLAARQDACLRLEVQLDLPSPPEYQAARMAYQVERLNASMKKELADQASAEDLLQTVFTGGAVPADAAEAIGQRIESCLAAWKNRG